MGAGGVAKMEIKSADARRRTARLLFGYRLKRNLATQHPIISIKQRAHLIMSYRAGEAVLQKIALIAAAYCVLCGDIFAGNVNRVFAKSKVLKPMNNKGIACPPGEEKPSYRK